MASALLARAMEHGGRLGEAAAAFPDAPRPWIDLSTGINPQPWRGPRAALADLARLPDPQGLRALEAAAADAFGVTDPRRVVAVPGAEAGLRLLPRLLGVGCAEIAAPTYGGHEQAARAADIPAARIGAAAIQASAADLLVVVNPNNPDGRTLDPATLIDLAVRRAKAGRWTLVDESFVDASPALSVAGHAQGRLVVLRSFGKFYGLAGVRLGFVIADLALAATLRESLGDWPVSTDAIVLGQAAYGDRAWRTRTQLRLARDARRLDRVLRRAGFTPVGGTSLFRLVSAPDARARFEQLCGAGVLTRPFAGEPAWLRFGLPAPQDWRRLEAALGGQRP